MVKARLRSKERLRVDVLSKIHKGSMTRRVGAGLLSVSDRQLKRVYSRYVLEGNAGLPHGLRFRPSNHLIGVERRQRILELYELKYGDFGPTLAVEYLLHDDGERVGIETLRHWLLF